ncbi:PSD1 and planctomycete cytochrome C domain-containing protein [Pricia sp. S334]|uniref:PSD1 and planctomycete cytochrome C domain-containing protein n=1 Tax=Pricia mediterranea TaxID=3076079 RepID=A0ABU3L3P2_9FLAO|nr:PSD1 and planctomycete cytochrome C domain-containing protein [Pricia sp. S334]MDT7828183.1 PSD1 and planctomycete cytochrome C domain-containing protein [Pricia sp. S334]
MYTFIRKGLEILTASLLIVVTLFLQSCGNSDPVDFSTQIKPILNSKCITCHGGVKKSGDFSLLFEEDAFAINESGKPAIIPGDASGSELIRRVHETDPELRMPYEKPPLSEEEIDLLTRWIDQGAEWGQHWAYSLPDKVEVPPISSNMESSQQAGLSPEGGSGPAIPSHFVRNDIDNFILTRLLNEKLRPNPPAEKNIIARRLALDITGLPPDQKLFDTFTEGDLSYESMVDTLLARKDYGEKWASWWLDLARYADTKGYEKDSGRSMWRYRDWLIQAFNQNMSYDRFTTEQLAGDLLPDPTTDQLIATAFHRNTMNNDEGGTEDEEFRVASVIDRVNTTFSVWQSTTMECVQCHSHTYDPFKHEEYYKAMAFFNNSRDEDTPDESPNIRFYDSVQQKKVARVNSWVQKYGSEKVAGVYEDFLRFNEPKYLAHNAEDFTNGELADTKYLALWDDGSCTLRNVYTRGAGFMYMKYRAGIDGTRMTIRKNNEEGEILAQFTIDKTNGNTIRKIPFKRTDEIIDLYLETNNDRIGKQVSTSFITWFAFLEDIPGKSKPGYRDINGTFLELLNADTPELPIMAENHSYMARATQVFERGNWLIKKDTVEPGVPESLNPWEPDWQRNRLGLSNWIVSKKNPLTARTLVNRVWHQLFGRGIVASVEDMGTQSDPPSHPELLDWLSLRLMNDHDWDMKALIKDIVMSGTYRQSSRNNPELYQKDPNNELLARGPRLRLSAEQIRDQALAVSGLLSDKMYGPGVMPPQPDGVWQSVYSNESWVESEGEDKYRRAVYTYLKRTSPYPSFITFDAGSREVCTIRRTVTNTPLQALVTLNDPVYLEAAYTLAKFMGGNPLNAKFPNGNGGDEGQTDDGDIDGIIAKGYEKATYSKITPEKLGALKALYEESLSEFENTEAIKGQFFVLEESPNPRLAALTVVANAIMNLDEFLSKA